MLWFIGGFVGILLVFWALRWFANSPSSVVAERIKKLIRFGLIGLGAGLTGSRGKVLGVALQLLSFLFKSTSKSHNQTPYKYKDTMSKAQARQILGVGPSANASEIGNAWRNLMRTAHPDKGGSLETAAKLNQARDVLLKKKV